MSQIPERPIKYAVIAARYQGKWVFCRHKKRTTWEIPGGHLEPGETPEETARRELWEETGALESDIHPVCLYSFSDFGVLFYADIQSLEPLRQESEIAEICLFESLPDQLTYPHIQPHLFRYVLNWLTNL